MKRNLLLISTIAMSHGIDPSLAFITPHPTTTTITTTALTSLSTAGSSPFFCTNANDAVVCNHNRHSSKDWMHNLASLPKSTVLREIANPMASVTLWATFLSLVHYTCLNCSSSSIMLQRVARSMCVSGEAHKFLASSLSLLLVFRTNSAYQRFVVRTLFLCVSSLIHDTIQQNEQESSISHHILCVIFIPLL